MSVFDGRDASASGGFPYASGPLTTETLTFGADGKFVTGQAEEFTFTVPGGVDFTLDVGGTTQLAASFTMLTAAANGSPAGRPEKIEFARDGYVYAVAQSGTRVPVFRIPLGQVTSPDNLTPLPGNVYSASASSGVVNIGFSQSDGLGDIMTSVPIMRNGEVIGYLILQLSFAADRRLLEERKLDPLPFMVDAAFRVIFGSTDIDFRRLRAKELEELTAAIASEANKRIGSDLIRHVLLQQLNFVRREDIRTNWIGNGNGAE